MGAMNYLWLSWYKSISNNKKAKFLRYLVFYPFLFVFFCPLRIRIRSVSGGRQGVRVLFCFFFLVVDAMGWAEAHGPAEQEPFFFLFVLFSVIKPDENFENHRKSHKTHKNNKPVLLHSY